MVTCDPAVSLSIPDQDHWSIYADKKFTKIVKWLAEECWQRQEEAEDKEEVEVKEEEVEKQGGEEAAAEATTAAELPNSTASTMEINGGGEGPNSGAPPPHSVSTQKPLECLMRDITLEAKDGDIIFPITPVGRPPCYNHEEGSDKKNTLPPSPSNLQCRGSEAGRLDPGGAPHCPVY